VIPQKRKSSAVKLGSPLKKESFFKKTQTYINNKLYKFKLWRAGIIATFMLKEKFNFILTWILNTIITGSLIYYIVNNQNFISYGLTMILSLYYLDIIVQIIKKPYTDKK